MAIKTTAVIQKILEYLDESMDDEIIDTEPIKHEALGITHARWSRTIGLMLEEDLIDGFIEVTTMGSHYDQYKIGKPRITFRGLNYLSENSNSAKLLRAAKELKDFIPGL